jgi:hypothetical protein
MLLLFVIGNKKKQIWGLCGGHQCHSVRTTVRENQSIFQQLKRHKQHGGAVILFPLEGKKIG